MNTPMRGITMPPRVYSMSKLRRARAASSIPNLCRRASPPIHEAMARRTLWNKLIRNMVYSSPLPGGAGCLAPKSLDYQSTVAQRATRRSADLLRAGRTDREAFVAHLLAGEHAHDS